MNHASVANDRDCWISACAYLTRFRSYLLAMCALWLLECRAAVADTEIRYEFLDNITAHVQIGNLKSDSLLRQRYSDDEVEHFTFSFLDRTVNYRNQAYFTLDSKTGALYTSQMIDRDVICANRLMCALQLDVAVQPAEYFQVLRVITVISDENDNAPVFPEKHKNVTVSESISTGVIASLLPAVDPDSSFFGVQGYRLIANKTIFELDQTEPSNLKVMLLADLDRESQDKHQLIITAFDGGPVPKTGSMVLTIFVADVNDNAPYFENPSIQVNISEDTLRGTYIKFISAQDADIGKNGELRYSFSNETKQKYGSIFRMNPSSGKIILTRTLDRETQDLYSLDVVAEDGAGSFPAEAKVIVNVIDVNDNIPEVVISPLQKGKHLLVMEGLPVNTFIAHVSVTDEDIGENGRVNCSLTDDAKQKFKLVPIYENEYKIMTNTVLRLAYDGPAMHKIILLCNDYGVPQLLRRLTIPVVVDDIDNHLPRFNQQLYTAVIQENNDPIEYLLQARAIKPQTATSAGDVIHTLGREAGNVFTINHTDGVISCPSSFNREVIGDVLEFRVLASDGGFIPLTAIDG